MPRPDEALARLLLPTPRQIVRTEGWLELGDTVSVEWASCLGEDRRLREALSRFAITAGLELETTLAPSTRLRLEDDGSPGVAQSERYRLEVTPRGITIRASTSAGAHCALATLSQLILNADPSHGAGATTEPGTRRLPAVVIDDWPDFAVRGIVLDTSRNKVPRLETLFELVDRLASWKINHLELYFEHVFAYPGHERVWGDASPYTPDEMRRLDAYCSARFVELTPNQNSLGHLHRWLVHEPYRRLAECPEGIEHPFSEAIEPFSLCPTDPAALALLEELYDTLLPCFGSRRVHVGLDETIEVGRGRSREACARRGSGRVYLDFLHRVQRLVSRRGRQMLFWADMILQHPELIPELPPDAVPVVWGYEANHPFAAQLAPLRAAGLETWVCPGTSSWMSFIGRLGNARENLLAAARQGLAQGARGYLIADWGDFGHLQPPAVSLPGLLVGAAAAWNVEAAERFGGDRAEAREALIDALGRWALPGTGVALARALCRAGDVYRATGVELMNSSVLFQVLHRLGEPFDTRRFERLDEAGLERASAELDAAAADLDRAAAHEGAPELVVAELRWALEMARLGADTARARLHAGRAAPAASLPAAVRAELAERLTVAERTLEPLWLASFRPGGLDESLARIERMRRALEGRDLGERDPTGGHDRMGP